MVYLAFCPTFISPRYVASNDFPSFTSAKNLLVCSISCLLRKCIHLSYPRKAFFCTDTTSSKARVILPSLSASCHVASVINASLWLKLHSCLLKLCRTMVQQGISTQTALPGMHRLGLLTFNVAQDIKVCNACSISVQCVQYKRAMRIT